MPRRRRSLCLFEIDPIVDSICHELEQGQLYACALVNRQWHASFNRHLWRTIRIRQPCKLLTFKQHLHSTLPKNARYIQTIDTAFAELFPLLQPFLFGKAMLPLLVSRTLSSLSNSPPHALPHNLARLHCRSLSQAKFTHVVNNTYLNDILILAHHSPHLQVLEFEHFQFTDEYVHLLTHVMQRHPRLRRVRIDSFQRVPLHMYLQLLWRAALHLESFEIACWPYDDHYSPHNDNVHGAHATADPFRTGIIPPDIDTTNDDDDYSKISFRIQHLDLGQCQIGVIGSSRTLTALLRHCTRLRSLILPNISFPLELRELSAVISETLTDLRHLDARAMETSDTLLSELVDACGGVISHGNSNILLKRYHGLYSIPKGGRPGLESFMAAGSHSVGWATVDALRTCHSATLTHLRFEGCAVMTGAMIQTLLCSCSALERCEMMMGHDARLRDDAKSEPYLSEGDLGPTRGLSTLKHDSWVTADTRPLYARLQIGAGVNGDSDEGTKEEEEVKHFAWACLGLQALSIRVAGTQKEIIPTVLGDQLCRLSDLRHVRIGSGGSNEAMIWDTGADSSIRETFCRLASMKRITAIELKGYKRHLSDENAAELAMEMQKLAIETLLS